MNGIVENTYKVPKIRNNVQDFERSKNFLKFAGYRYKPRYYSIPKLRMKSIFSSSFTLVFGICLLLAILFPKALTAQQSSDLNKLLYQTRDLTKENIFSRNIEGPVVDGRGRLFVVNFENDGTIGLVNDNGECQVFVRLPEGSVGNSLRFGKRGELYVADFKRHNVLRVDTSTRKVSIYAYSEEFNQPNDLCIRSNG
jgi:hypothetical protein